MNWQVSFSLWILQLHESLLKNMCNWKEKKNVDAKYNMAELVYLAWDREINFGLELGPDLKEPT